jgi:hypothetical protein
MYRRQFSTFLSSVANESSFSASISFSREGSFSTVLDTSQEESTLLDNSRHAPLSRGTIAYQKQRGGTVTGPNQEIQA